MGKRIHCVGNAGPRVTRQSERLKKKCTFSITFLFEAIFEAELAQGKKEVKPPTTNTTRQKVVTNLKRGQSKHSHSPQRKRSRPSSQRPSSSTSNPAFDGSPPIPVDFETQQALTACTSSGKQGDNFGQAPQADSISFQFESSNCPQAVSVPNGLKSTGKTFQPKYCCPQCHFPCWLCHTTEVSEPPQSDGTTSESGQLDGAQSDSNQSETITTGQSLGLTKRSKRTRFDGLKLVGPKDAYFAELVLGPSGVTIWNPIENLTPGIIPIDTIKDVPSVLSQVRINVDSHSASRIALQFHEYHNRTYDEETYSTLVSKFLAPFADYVDAKGPEGVVSLRRGKYKPRKEGPQVPSTTGYTYDWDIEPDITYMIAINMFPDKTRKALAQLGLHWLLSEPQGVCPYLTLELKCAEKTGKDSEAICQISAASAVWLYQRKRLKDQLGSSDFSDLQHYSIILNSTDFHVWVASFDGETYTVRRLAGGKLNDPEGVKTYAKWVNAIHEWGLGMNARAFKRDVGALCSRAVKRASRPSLPLPASDLQAMSS
ncbi:hypothetical protein MMC30_008708 [Trapelia coarctata]|nr:hypothetical protein [Trapelia coarctata]